jgi:hypothetical protein
MTTERWTDERLDRLAALSESNAQRIRELRASSSELRESPRGQQITAVRLLQMAAQDKQKWKEFMARNGESQKRWEQFEVSHRESVEQFNVVLAEVRHLSGRLNGMEPTA